MPGQYFASTICIRHTYFVAWVQRFLIGDRERECEIRLRMRVESDVRLIPASYVRIVDRIKNLGLEVSTLTNI